MEKQDDFFGNNGAFEEIQKSITKEQQKETDNRMLLAKKIAIAIDCKGIKKNELAKQMGTDPSVVSRWLSGTQNIGSDVLFRLSDLLDIELVNLSITQDGIKVTSEIKLSNTLAAKEEEYANFFKREGQTFILKLFNANVPIRSNVPIYA